MSPLRFSIALLVVAMGCVASIPEDPGLSADFAAETARMVLVMRQGMPPLPTPSGPTRCDNCNGTGKIGDGRVVMTCPECNGEGVKATSVCVEGCDP